MIEKEEKLFNEIFLQYYSLLFNYGKTIIRDEHIVEECIQELFLYIYQKKIDFATIRNIKSYLLVSFKRRILLKKKSSSKTQDLPNVIPDMHFDAEDFEATKEEHKKRNSTLVTMLNELPWRQREAVYLKYFNKLSSKEVAEIMGIQPQVVANTIYKAIKKLKQSADRLLFTLMMILFYLE